MIVNGGTLTTGDLRIGLGTGAASSSSASGTVLLQTGSKIAATNLYVGSGGGTGFFEAQDSSKKATLIVSGDAHVGSNGAGNTAGISTSGTFDFENYATGTINGNFSAGELGGNGLLLMNGGTLVIGSTLGVGIGTTSSPTNSSIIQPGTGTLLLNGSTLVTGAAAIGTQGGVGTATIQNSNWFIGSYSGTGNMTVGDAIGGSGVTGTGYVSVNSGGYLAVDYNLTINSGGFMQINGGTLQVLGGIDVSHFDGLSGFGKSLGSLDFESGTVRVSNFIDASPTGFAFGSASTPVINLVNGTSLEGGPFQVGINGFGAALNGIGPRYSTQIGSGAEVDLGVGTSSTLGASHPSQGTLTLSGGDPLVTKNLVAGLNGGAGTINITGVASVYGNAAAGMSTLTVNGGMILGSGGVVGTSGGNSVFYPSNGTFTLGVYSTAAVSGDTYAGSSGGYRDVDGEFVNFVDRWWASRRPGDHYLRRRAGSLHKRKRLTSTVRLLLRHRVMSVRRAAPAW